METKVLQKGEICKIILSSNLEGMVGVPSGIEAVEREAGVSIVDSVCTLTKIRVLKVLRKKDDRPKEKVIEKFEESLVNNGYVPREIITEGYIAHIKREDLDENMIEAIKIAADALGVSIAILPNRELVALRFVQIGPEFGKLEEPDNIATGENFKEILEAIGVKDVELRYGTMSSRYEILK